MSETIKTAEELAVENEKLKEQVSSLEDKMNEILSALKAGTPAVAPNVTFVAPDNNVHIVYMSDSLGHLEANGFILDATKYGEEFTVSISQADAIVGKYRRWFDKGILAIAARDIKYATGKGLRTDAEFALTAEKLNAIGTMSSKAIENLWNTSSEEQKHSIVTFFKRKIIEHKDLNYLDRERIDTLNRLSDGGFKREVSELSGDFKIHQTDM